MIRKKVIRQTGTFATLALVGGAMLTPASATTTGITFTSGDSSVGAVGTTTDIASTQSTVLPTTDRIIVTFAGGVTEEEKANIIAEVEASLHSTIASVGAETTPLVNTQEVKKTVNGATVVATDVFMDETQQNQAIQALLADERIISAEPDLRVENAQASYPTTPNDTYYGDQWNLNAISAPQAWQTATGEGVLVGVLDSGSSNNPDLAGKWVSGYDFVTGAYDNDNEPGRDSDPTDVGMEAPGIEGHGTHVAGIIAANTNNNMGVAGVAPDAMIQASRIFGLNGTSYISDFADGIEWASGGHVPGVPDNPTPVNVINLSEAFPADKCPASMQTAIYNAHARNVPVVVSAGNTGVNADYVAPANCDGAIVVGATAMNNVMTGYSNWGGMLDVLAPGGAVNAGQIFSTLTNQGKDYGNMNGTSMAAPHVAGIIALMKQTYPAISVEEVRSILKTTGTPTGYGYPVVNAERAVEATRALVPTTETPVADSNVTYVYPESLNVIPGSAESYAISPELITPDNVESPVTASSFIINKDETTYPGEVTVNSDGTVTLKDTAMTEWSYQVVVEWSYPDGATAKSNITVTIPPVVDESTAPIVEPTEPATPEPTAPVAPEPVEPDAPDETTSTPDPTDTTQPEKPTTEEPAIEEPDSNTSDSIVTESSMYQLTYAQDAKVVSGGTLHLDAPVINWDENYTEGTGTPNVSAISYALNPDAVIPEGVTVVVDNSGAITVSVEQSFIDYQKLVLPIVATYSDGSIDTVEVIVDITNGAVEEVVPEDTTGTPAPSVDTKTETSATNSSGNGTETVVDNQTTVTPDRSPENIANELGVTVEEATEAQNTFANGTKGTEPTVGVAPPGVSGTVTQGVANTGGEVKAENSNLKTGLIIGGIVALVSAIAVVGVVAYRSRKNNKII